MPSDGFTHLQEIASGLLEMSHDAIIIRDLGGKVSYWNRGAEVLYGWNASEAIGKLAHQLLQTISPTSVAESAKALRDTGYWEGEVHQTARSQKALIVCSRCVACTGKEEEIVVLEVNRDITAQKHMEAGFRGMNRELTLRFEELAAAEERFRSLLECAPDPTVIVNSSGQMVMVNTQTKKQFGYEQDELLGNSIEMLLPERFRGAHTGHRASYLSHQRIRLMGNNFALFGLRKNGDEFPVEVFLNPIEAGLEVMVAASIRNTSDKRPYDQLSAGNDHHIKDGHHARDQSLEHVSHNLHTPLQAVMALATRRKDSQNGS